MTSCGMPEHPSGHSWIKLYCEQSGGLVGKVTKRKVSSKVCWNRLDAGSTSLVLIKTAMAVHSWSWLVIKAVCRSARERQISMLVYFIRCGPSNQFAMQVCLLRLFAPLPLHPTPPPPLSLSLSPHWIILHGIVLCCSKTTVWSDITEEGGQGDHLHQPHRSWSHSGHIRPIGLILTFLEFGLRGARGVHMYGFVLSYESAGGSFLTERVASCWSSGWELSSNNWTIRKKLSTKRLRLGVWHAFSNSSRAFIATKTYLAGGAGRKLAKCKLRAMAFTRDAYPVLCLWMSRLRRCAK